MSSGVPITWNNAQFSYSSNTFNWDDVKAIIEGGKSRPDRIKEIIDGDEEAKKRFIEVIVRVKGNQEYSNSYIYNQKKEIDMNLDVTIEDIKLVIQEYQKAKMTIKNINV